MNPGHGKECGPDVKLDRKGAAEMPDQKVKVLGAGLAGCEAAWALAQRGIANAFMPHTVCNRHR